MKFKNLIFIGITAAFLGTGYLLLFKKQSQIIEVQQSTANYEPVQKKFLQRLTDKLNNIWQTFAQKRGIDKAKIETMLEQQYQTYKKINIDQAENDQAPQPSPEVKNLVISVMKDFGINSDEITIVANPKMGGAAQVIDDYTLQVHEQNLAIFSLPAQKFIIGHELQHILHKDHSTCFFIRNSLPGQEKEELFFHKDHPLMQYYRFREERADIAAAIKNAEWANNYLIYAQESLEKRGNLNADWHLKTSYRLDLAKDIVNEFNTTVQTA